MVKWFGVLKTINGCVTNAGMVLLYAGQEIRALEGITPDLDEYTQQNPVKTSSTLLGWVVFMMAMVRTPVDLKDETPVGSSHLLSPIESTLLYANTLKRF
jgi:hypothetical protein